METNNLIEKLDKLPESLKKEVEDFVDFLIYKNGNQEEQQLNDKPLSGFGSGKGIFGKIADDFDEPLDEMKEYM